VRNYEFKFQHLHIILFLSTKLCSHQPIVLLIMRNVIFFGNMRIVISNYLKKQISAMWYVFL